MDLYKLKKEYARLLLQYGVALKAGQYLVVEIQAEQVAFSRILVQTAMESGAKDAIVFFRDDYVDRSRIEYGDPAEYLRLPAGTRADMEHYFSEGAASISFLSPRPQLLERCSFEVRSDFAAFMNNTRNIVRAYIEKGIHWCYAGLPNRDWASYLFPDLEPEAAEEALWRTILKICFVSESRDARGDWLTYYDRNNQYQQWLNRQRFDRIHFYNTKGTDFTVGLSEKAVWEGAYPRSSVTPDLFQPNIPSYEIFTSPDYSRTSGVVHASRPLYLSGTVIRGLWLKFVNGLVVEFGAEQGAEVLSELMRTDAGSKRLGEISFVEAGQAIENTGLVFYNTLFDENAACHIALGNGFANAISGFDEHKEPADRYHLNRSGIHVDIMFGTPDLNADGYDAAGHKTPIFQSGKFACQESQQKGES